MSHDRKYRIIISGGGTGGHVYPAIAIAEALKSGRPESEILFVGAKGRFEMQKVPEAGFPIEGLWISGLQRRLTWGNALFPLKVISSLLKSYRIIRRFKPEVVVGVGGYASGPLLYMASRMKIPTLIQEQNSYPGITNRTLAKRADRICVAYNGMEKYFPIEKIRITGNPVRKIIRAGILNQGSAREKFGLDPRKKTLLVTGGSLGARTINRATKASLEKLSEKDIQLIWQCGKFYFDEFGPLEKELPGKIRVLPFIREMDLAYEAADVVVARAGAITISELCLVGKPVILIPSPNVAEDHQTKNARSLYDAGAVEMIRDDEAVEKMAGKVAEMIFDEGKLAAMGDAITRFAKPDAARDIAEEVIRLADRLPPLRGVGG